MKGLLFLLMLVMIQQICEAAPKQYKILDPTLKIHLVDKERLSHQELNKKGVSSKWFNNAEVSKIYNRECPFKWEISKADLTRTPKHIVEAKLTCKDCELSCKALLYHISVRVQEQKGNGESKKYWKIIPVVVGYFYRQQEN